MRLATRSADNGDNETLRVDADKLTLIYSCTVFEGCAPSRFQKDGKLVYFETNKGDDVNLSALTLLDPATGKTQLVESDPLKKVDFGDAEFSEATDELVVTTYVDAKIRRYYKDKSYEADYKWLESKLPNMEITRVSETLDDRMWLVAAHSDTEPGVTYLFDRKTKKLTKQFRLWEKLPREALAERKPVTYKSSDGLEIPAYLTLPKGVPAKALPLIMLPHGGPWARDMWRYDSFAQFLPTAATLFFSPISAAPPATARSF